MIVLAMLAAAVTPAGATRTPDIVVVAEKLRKIRLSADSDDQGRITACRVTISSGDAKLDEQVGRTDKRWERKKGVGEPAAEAGVGEARKGGSSSPEDRCS